MFLQRYNLVKLKKGCRNLWYNVRRYGLETRKQIIQRHDTECQPYVHYMQFSPLPFSIQSKFSNVKNCSKKHINISRVGKSIITKKLLLDVIFGYNSYLPNCIPKWTNVTCHTSIINTFAASYLNTQGLNNSCLKSLQLRP